MGLLPSIARDLNVSEGVAGLSVTLYGILAGLLAPIATILTSRIDRRTVLLVILTVFTVGNALSATAYSYPMFMASRFLSGVIHGLMWAIVASIAIRLVAETDAVRATAAVFSGISLALVLGVPAAAFVGDLYGWRSAFAALAVLSGVSLVLVRALLPPLSSSGTFAFPDLASLLRQPRLRRVLAVTALMVIANYSAYTYIAPFLQDARGLAPQSTGPFLLIYGIAGVAGNFAAGALLSRARTVRAVLVALAVVLTGALMSLQVARLPIILAVLIAVWGASYSAMPVALQTLVLRIGGGRTGEAATSLYVLVFNCSIALGASAGAVAIDTAGPTVPALVGAAVCAVGLVPTLSLRRA
ncbi:arabinose efflux permease family protein [Mycolicibacterium cosmeticum]|uniref:Arabinose efflux permease family protein n=2 Tax=Mycolicibacterium cosmeticum TaxID=258533 RepID=W9ATM6_MYCCO|nr:arabinose efflux permease family protein [Mycolicibacterium cosmeticum]